MQSKFNNPKGEYMSYQGRSAEEILKELAADKLRKSNASATIHNPAIEDAKRQAILFKRAALESKDAYTKAKAAEQVRLFLAKAGK